ncbi:death-associated protein kinase 3-like [Ylistrum balloti]|uniref:death-associated protein kinase 3-like n=1 Tax=Ylistrum balloti TaxID=509963 RepID=UPI002905938C|nr:death-associated protein kinase 3-like [Ylistrum balloti]
MAFLSETRFTPKFYGLLPDPTDPRNLLIAMEMIGSGMTLRKKIEENTPTERQKLSISLRLSIGLHTIHDKNVLLNDQKDDNVIVYSLNGTVFQAKFIDFGHASCGFEKRYGGNATTNARCTHLAPEVRAGEPTKASSDVYSLGFVMALFRIDKLANIVSQCMGHEPGQRPCLPIVVRNLMDLM